MSDPYPPIGDYAVLGDCHTAALVSKTGSVDWCCLPRFDKGSSFGRLLDWESGGHCSVSPAALDGDWNVARDYRDGTLVLDTTFNGPEGELVVTDCLALGGRKQEAEERQLIRIAECKRGAVRVQLRVAPRFDYGAVGPWIRKQGPSLWSALGGDDGLLVWSDTDLAEDPEHELSGAVDLHAGEKVRLSVSYVRPERCESALRVPDAEDLDRRVAATCRWWRRWSRRGSPPATDPTGTLRSAMILKALTYSPTGAIIAAPTTSLPEAPGGERNWDYRYAWIRDASFSVRALTQMGYEQEADAFRRFVERSAAGSAADLQILYGPGGERRTGEWIVDEMAGWRGARPVRVGNNAHQQRQIDSCGEIVSQAYRWHQRGASPDDDFWRFLFSVIDSAVERWKLPDHGLWEWPGKPDHFVHSKVMAWAALDRGLALADECMRQAPARRWRRARNAIRRAVERDGYDSRRGVFVQAFGRKALDAALLLLPTTGFLDWKDERFQRTVAAIREDLGTGDGLVYRYRRKDGLPGQEGAFLACSFWLVEALARGGDVAEARSVYDHALAHGNDLGLFSEEIEPDTGELLGNFPQGLTHLSHITAAVALDEAEVG